jgi:hypothetical protein
MRPVTVKEENLELLLAQRSKCRLGVLCKDRFGHPLPEPRNAIFRVLYNKNRPVSGDVKLLARGMFSSSQWLTESIHGYILPLAWAGRQLRPLCVANTEVPLFLAGREATIR